MPDVQFRAYGTGSLWIGRLVTIGGIGLMVVLILNYNSIVSWFRSSVQPEPPKPPPGEVLLWVASVPIRAYSEIQPGMIKSLFKKESVIPSEVLRRDADIVYRVAIEDIAPDTAFRETMLAPRGTKPGLAAGIPPGWGAVTLRAEDVDGVLTHLKTGNSVAIVAIWADESASSPRRATLVSKQAKVLLPLQGRTVQGVGGGGGNPLVGRGGGGGPRSTVIHELTLTLPPNDLLRLSEAQGKATLRIILLSGIEGGAQFEALRSTPEESSALIELIRGDQSSIQIVRPTEGREENHDK
jgi:Flp pilus assembly protein CpaB